MVSRTTEGKGSYRWKILRNAIVNKSLVNEETEIFQHSVRRFTSFGLFNVTKHKIPVQSTCEASQQSSCIWSCFVCPELNLLNEVWVKEEQVKINFKDMTSYNNTGNVCIWPSEEVMAYYCLANQEKFDGKSVIELGGGKSSLAGVCLALNCTSSRILLTEGDERCVKNLFEIVERNQSRKRCESLQVCSLRWNEEKTYTELGSAFDYIICADCLFFVDNHSQLLATIHHILKPGGEALLFSPRRGTTLAQFKQLASQSFAEVVEDDQYMRKLSQLHEQYLKSSTVYQPDIHYPVLLKLRKS